MKISIESVVKRNVVEGKDQQYDVEFNYNGSIMRLRTPHTASCNCGISLMKISSSDEHFQEVVQFGIGKLYKKYKEEIENYEI